MKRSKIFIIALCVMIGVSLVGCQNSSNSSNAVAIDEYEWEISTIQAGEDGAVIACSKEKKSAYESAAEIQMNCIAEEGFLTITDATNRDSYKGTYKQQETDKETVIYEFTLGLERGHDVTSMTIDLEETRIPTLILTTTSYTFYFFSKQKK